MPAVRILGFAALLLVVGACDTGAPAASADARTASTVVPITDGTADLVYTFHPIDSKDEWDGSFTATSLDANGKPIVTFSQTRSDGPSPSYSIDFAWDATIAASASVRYLAIAPDGTVTELGRTDDWTPGGDGDRPARSYHTTPNGVTRIDYPQDGDPASTIHQRVVAPDGDVFDGTTDVELSFPPDAKTRTAVAVEFTYPSDVTFEYGPAGP